MSLSSPNVINCEYNLDLQTFREALVVLQRQVDELDELKAAHYQEIIEHEEEVWDVVQGKVSQSTTYNDSIIIVCIGLHCCAFYNGRLRSIYGKSV